jgi:SAM-dependent methyltransferase
MPENDRVVRVACGRLSEDGRYAGSDLANVFRLQGVERGVLQLLAEHGVVSLREKRILEIGCGTGHWLREFVKWGADPATVAGLDVQPDRIAVARRRCPVGTRLVRGNGADLPFPDGDFDVVALFTLFTSLHDPELKRRVAGETMRVLKSRGLVLWYDFHIGNPRNPDVRAVGRREIGGLFPGSSITLRRVTLAPPIARFIAPRSWSLCTMLDAIPLLRTHYLGAIRKP